MHLEQAWNKALVIWKPYFSYPLPLWCETHEDIQTHQVQDHLGHVRLSSGQIELNGPYIQKSGLNPHLDLVLAHELGHLLLAPRHVQAHSYFLFLCAQQGSLYRQHMGLLANTYEDILINWHLQAVKGVDIRPILPFLLAREQDAYWGLIARVYELLWRLPATTFCQNAPEDLTEATARELALMFQAPKQDWLHSAPAFLNLITPFLPSEPQSIPLMGDIQEVPEHQSKGLGSFLRKTQPVDQLNPPMGVTPQDYFEILQEIQAPRALQKTLEQYYLEYARDYILAWPDAKSLRTEPQFEGHTLWDQGDAIQDIDWLESLIRSPIAVPGMTLQQRFSALLPSAEFGPPQAVDIYLDGSGSMPNPFENLSLFALISTIIALSAQSLDIPVRVTLWGTETEWQSSDWQQDIEPLLPMLTGYLGGMTRFPKTLFQERLAEIPAQTQVFIVSDQGLIQEDTQRFFSHTPMPTLPPILLLSLLPGISLEPWESLPLKLLPIVPEKLPYILHKVYELCTSNLA